MGLTGFLPPPGETRKEYLTLGGRNSLPYSRKTFRSPIGQRSPGVNWCWQAMGCLRMKAGIRSHLLDRAVAWRHRGYLAGPDLRSTRSLYDFLGVTDGVCPTRDAHEPPPPAPRRYEVNPTAYPGADWSGDPWKPRGTYPRIGSRPAADHLLVDVPGTDGNEIDRRTGRGLCCCLVYLDRGGMALADHTEHPSRSRCFDQALVKRGADLASIGNCTRATRPRRPLPMPGGLGSRHPFGTIYSTNITPDPDRHRSLAGNRVPAGHARGRAQRRSHLYPAFPYDHFTKARDDDLHAIYAFIITREPVRAAPPPKTCLSL